MNFPSEVKNDLITITIPESLDFYESFPPPVLPACGPSSPGVCRRLFLPSGPLFGLALLQASPSPSCPGSWPDPGTRPFRLGERALCARAGARETAVLQQERFERPLEQTSKPAFIPC